MKRLFMFLLLIFTVFLLAGSASSSSPSILQNGQSITLSNKTPVCSSKQNVDKLLFYLNQKNDSGVQSMYNGGEVKDLPKGTKVNVVNIGLVTEVETSGTHWFAPMELFK